jgi:hypothetical protein
MEWAEGYPAGSDYTFGYYRQLNPVFARFAMTTAGLAAPPMRTACELGFGHGVSAAMHQAASGADWWGTDFMPGQAAYAQALAGPAARLAEQGFAEFCNRTDLPDFDFVCAHGIWSWISAENRAILVEFLRRKLRPGGVFHVSYNAEAGWAGLRPFRHLLLRHTEVMSAASTNPVEAIRHALPFIARVFAAQSVYAAQNPAAPAMRARIAADVSVYHAHEYLGQHWNPMHVADVAAELAPAKLSYGCSGRILDRVAPLTLPPAQRALVDGIADPVLRETVFDLMGATRFRRDYWVKGPRTLGPAERAEALADLRVVLVAPPGEVAEIRPQTHAGEVTLPLPMFTPVLDAVSDHLPHRLGDIAEQLAPGGLGAHDVLQAVLVLCDLGTLQPAHDDDAAVERATAPVAALNARILARARHGGELGHLANPATGGGTEVSRLQQLLLAAEQGGADAAEQEAFAAEELSEAPAQVRQAAAQFHAGRRAVLRIQGVA